MAYKRWLSVISMPTWLPICPRSDINWDGTKEKHKGITRTTRKGIIREIADFVTQFGDNIVSIPEDFLPLHIIILVLALESFWLSRISFKVIPDQGAMSISIDFLSLQFCEISEQRTNGGRLEKLRQNKGSRIKLPVPSLV